jgi:hypothetical protein
MRYFHPAQASPLTLLAEEPDSAAVEPIVRPEIHHVILHPGREILSAHVHTHAQEHVVAAGIWTTRSCIPSITAYRWMTALGKGADLSNTIFIA